VSTVDLSLQPENFRRSLAISLGLHIVVISVLTIKTVFFDSDPTSYQSVIKVDLVGLPDKIEPQQIPTEESPKAEPKISKPAPQAPISAPAEKKLAEKVHKVEIDKTSINLEKTKKKEQAAIDKLKQLSALDEIERQEQEDTKLKNQEKAIERLKQIKGNALSSGTELRGVTKLQHDNYISVVEKHIRQNWSLPEWLAKKKLSALIRVRFDEHGNVASHEIVKTSGNQTFDDLVISAVQKSSPVPAPPPKFVKILNVEGILLGFPE
jgi:colicin import membrane protein